MGSLEDAENTHSPPGNFFQRFFKQLWYISVHGAVIALGDMIKDIFVKTPTIDLSKVGQRSGQTVVMTGGPRGIGFGIVKKLLQLDYTVILGVRNIPQSEKRLDEIRKLGHSTGRVIFFQLDLKSLRSVRDFASQVLACKEGERLDLLINNAGIMNVPYEKTEDQFESQFQVNYLSHFLLTNLLLPRMKETSLKKNKPCHILNTSSHGQQGGKIDFDELETSKVYSPVKCYFDSKLCQVLHVKSLQKKFQDEGLNIHAFAVHPGEIPTDLWEGLGPLIVFLQPIVARFCRTTDGAATTVLYPVLTPEVSETYGGKFFVSGKVATPNPQADNTEIQQRLWERSLQLTEKTY